MVNTGFGRLSCYLLAVNCLLFASHNFAQDAQCEATELQPSKQHNLRRQIDSEDPLPKATANAKITHIELKQLNVFNTELEEENNALFRFANRAHITTEPDVIKSILLFSEGDSYSPHKLLESERLLRKQNYLYDARILAKPDCEGNIAVKVLTRDLWTLLPEISFSRSGGENKSSIGFRESNFLGWGKRVSVSRTTDADRTGYLFVYDDPNIFSSRYRGRFEYSDNDDGKRHYLDLSYPFFSVETPYSYGLLSYSDQRDESLYNRGEVISKFQQKTTLSRLYFGHSYPFSNNWTQRLTLGIETREDTFAETPQTTLEIADNRSLSYPYVSGQWFEDHYIKVRNFDSMSRTEDLNLGWNIRALLGYSDKDFSDDASRTIYSASVSKAHFVGNNQLWRFKAELDGYWNEQTDDVENLFINTQIQYYLNTSIDQSWYSKVRLQYAENLSADKQLTLGGENGLRGYPLNYQIGDRSFLINLEKRYYWEYNLLQLFKVGGAAFFDIGRAWQPNNTLADNNKVLKDVGVGLRLAPSRANAGTMIHLDIAVPIDNNDDNVDSVQWLVTVKNTF